MKQAQLEVSVEELVARSSALEEQIRALQKVIENYTEALMSVRAAKELIRTLSSEHSNYILLSGDKRGNLLFRATLSEEKALVHVGLNIYAEADPTYASRVLDNKEKMLNEQLDRVKKEYESRAKEYKRLQDILYSISAQQE